MSQSYDGSQSFQVRKLSILSQNIFQPSFDSAVTPTTERKDGLPFPDTPKTAQEKLSERRVACCNFIELVFFMFSFLFLVYLHEDIEQVFGMEHLLEIEITRPFGQHSHTIRDIREVAEIWEWIDDSLLPVMINHKDEVGHYLSREDWGYLADYNRVIGGLRFEQTRSKNVECEYDLHEFYGYCQPIHTHNHHSFGYPECEVKNSTNTTTHGDDVDVHNITICYNQEYYKGAIDFYHDEGFTMDEYSKVFEMWIDLIDDEHNIWKRVNYLKDRHWIDRETIHLMVEVLVYNSQEEPLISKVLVEFEFTRGNFCVGLVEHLGYVTPSIHISTLTLNPYFVHGVLKGILEVLYVLMLFDRLLTEAKQMRARTVSNQNEAYPILKSIKDHYWTDGVGSWLDLTNIVVGGLLCVEWTLLVMNLKEVEHGLAALHRPSSEVSYDDNDNDVWSDYHHDIADIELIVDEAIINMAYIRGCSMLVVFAMVFEFFKVLEGIPALKRVADTLQLAGSPLASFAVVLSMLVSLFAGAGMLAFGQKMEAFHNMYNSIVSTLLVTTTGSSDVYAEQFKMAPIIATIWYWLLVTIMYLVCLRLILCILMDAYGEASEANDDMIDDISLFEQTSDTLSYLVKHHCGYSTNDGNSDSARESVEGITRSGSPNSGLQTEKESKGAWF